MSQPETCGAAGGALSLWVKLIGNCLDWCGIVSSRTAGSSGSLIYRYTNYIG